MASFLRNCLSVSLFFLLVSVQTAASEPSAGKDTLDTLLEMSLEELVEVEISLATRNPLPIHKAPAIATVITAKEIRDMGAKKLMDVLKMVPGIHLSRNEQGFFMFDVRGISTVTSEKILVLIDGHSLNNNYGGSGLKYFGDYLSVEEIKQVEIVRGPGSALYGANAFLAVINVVTKKAEDLHGLELSYSRGSFDYEEINMLGGKSYDNGLQTFVSLDYWQTGGPDLEIEADRFFGTPLSNAPGRADSGFEATEFLLKLSYKDFSYQGHYLKNDRGAYIGLANSLTDDNTLKYENYWQELRYHFLDLASLSTALKLYWDQFEQDASVQLMPAGFLGTYPNGMIGGPKVKDRTLGGELQVDYDITVGNHLLLGLVYEKMKQYDVKSISNFDPNTLQYLGSVQDISSWGNWNKNVDREIYAAYFQDEWRITDNLNLTAGLRYDHYSDFGDTTNPRVGLVWTFLENTDLKLLYGQAFRAPSFNELYNQNNPSLVGYEDLQPEEIKTYEASVGYRFFDHLRFDLNYYYNDIDKLIVRDNSVSPARYGNLGGAEIDGFELVLAGDYSEDKYWRISYSHQDPEDAETKKRIPYVPGNQAALSFNYVLYEHFVFHTDIMWIDSRPRPAGDTRADMPSYATVDLALTVKDFHDNLEIRGVIHNLLDKNYRDPDLSGASMFIPDDYPRAGMSAFLEIRCIF